MSEGHADCRFACRNVTLTYDPALRLYQAAGAVTTRFAYDGANAIAEYDASNALQRRYVFGPGIDEPIVQYEGSGTAGRLFLEGDERGSIVSLSDGAGNLVVGNRYDEYGKPQSTNSGRFQYTGQMWVPEIGAYYYKTRVYLPHLGIFVQTDPVEYADSANVYVYVGDDPVNFVDPLGLGPEIVVTGQRDQSNGSEFAPWSFSSFANNSEKRPPSPIFVIGKRPTLPPVPLPLQIPHCVICNATVTGSWGAGFIITARRPPNAPFILIDGRYVYSGYVKPSYSNYFDACFVLCPPVIAGLIAGPEFVTAAGTRIAPFGNRTRRLVGQLPHYHRRVVGPDGETVPGQGIRWHRPWERFP